jgi:hypothetical protein
LLVLAGIMLVLLSLGSRRGNGDETS